MLRQTNHKGFTIIEVVITIAIGAAVMALVLNAVQGARRSQRNLNRAADVSAITGAVGQFSANRNALPAAFTDIEQYIEELAHYQANATAILFDPAVTATTSLTPVIGTGSTGDNLGTVARDANADSVVLIPGAECAATDHTVANTSQKDDVIANGSLRQIVIAYRVEGDPNIFCEEI